MKLWDLNPRMVERRPPHLPPEQQGSVVCVIDCPCRVCGVPVVLPRVASVTFPALGETLTPLQWRLLLNGYRTDDGFLYREVPAVDCRWIGIVRAGRLFIANLDGTEGADDEQPLRRDAGEIRAILARARGGVSIRGR